MSAGDKAPFRERLGSAFENGYGNEGRMVKAAYVFIMAALITCSSGIALVCAPVWVLKRLKRKSTATPVEESKPDTDTPSAP